MSEFLMLYSLWSDYPYTCSSVRKVDAYSAFDVNISVHKNACNLAKEKHLYGDFLVFLIGY